MSPVVVVKEVAKIVVRSPGPAGARGDPGGFTEFTFSTPATTHTINHNLGRHPAVVQALDLAGQPVGVGVNHIDDNTTAISTNAPFAGSVWVG